MPMTQVLVLEQVSVSYGIRGTDTPSLVNSDAVTVIVCFTVAQSTRNHYDPRAWADSPDSRRKGGGGRIEPLSAWRRITVFEIAEKWPICRAFVSGLASGFASRKQTCQRTQTCVPSRPQIAGKEVADRPGEQPLGVAPETLVRNRDA
jgi:hypothetical protein